MQTNQTTIRRKGLVSPATVPTPSAAKAAAGVFGFAALTALGAAVALPLPFTPVPVTLQTLFVVLAGIALGPRLGLVSMAFYVTLGSVGYHVFAGGTWGLATLPGATGGYLVGFVLAQPLVGWLAWRRNGRWRDLLAGALAGHALIFTTGVAWLAVWLNVGVAEALALGFAPFVPGCVLKTFAAAGLGRGASRWFRPLRS